MQHQGHPLKCYKCGVLYKQCMDELDNAIGHNLKRGPIEKLLYYTGRTLSAFSVHFSKASMPAGSARLLPQNPHLFRFPHEKVPHSWYSELCFETSRLE